MLWLLLLIPTAAGIAALGLRNPAALRRTLLPAAAAAHTALTAMCWAVRPEPVLNGWLGLDELSLLVLSITSGLFLAAAVYATGYLRREPPRKTDFQDGGLFTDAPEARFVACLLLFLATMTLVTLSQHLGLLWVGVEATTLASAPLIYFHRHHRTSRGHLEIPAHLLGRDRARPAGQFLPRRGRHGLARGAPDGRAPPGARRPARPRVAEGGLPLPAGRLRDQDGARPDAHLAAGRAQRGPLGGLGAALRGAAQLRLPRDPAGPRAHAARPAWGSSAGSC